MASLRCCWDFTGAKSLYLMNKGLLVISLIFYVPSTPFFPLLKDSVISCNDFKNAKVEILKKLFL